MKPVCPECSSEDVLFVTKEEAYWTVKGVDENGTPINLLEIKESIFIDDLGWFCESCVKEFDNALPQEE